VVAVAESLFFYGPLSPDPGEQTDQAPQKQGSATFSSASIEQTDPEEKENLH